MNKHQKTKAFRYFISAILLIFLLISHYLVQPTTPSDKSLEHFTVSKRAQKHILYGDHAGGGHKYGLGKPCKSEFPKSWSDDNIIQTVSKIAANDNLSWKQQNNGYFTTEKMHQNIRVRVVMNAKKSAVITAYPTNVTRNPCPNYNR